MRKIFVTMLLLGSAVAAFAQGTVYFSNNPFEQVSLAGLGPVPTNAGLFNFGLVYGIGATQPATLTFLGVEGVNSPSLAGVIVNTTGSSITALQIPGTTPGETDVWIQIAGWSGSYGTDWAAAQSAAGAWFGVTRVINVGLAAGGLGPSTGPGALIWQTIAGTDRNKFTPLVLSLTPEPSTTALFGLGVAAVLIFRRRK